MIPPSHISVSEEEFQRLAKVMFPDADQDTLARLYIMVSDLRELSRVVSEIAQHDGELSITAIRK